VRFVRFYLHIFTEYSAVCIWKRAQILVAEAWAAFYPQSSSATHPLFPIKASIQQLTMFADYRVPQILHHLRILSYPPTLLQMLKNKTSLENGSREEVSVRAASVIGVERVRDEILKIQSAGEGKNGNQEVSSVLIDFYLWDLAKRVENGEETIEDVETAEMVPAHRTRSIWY
jgi:Potential Queuosine, Q, salvage protein family